MKLIIWVRTDIDWSSISEDEFYAQDSILFSRYKELITEYYSVWKQCFSLSYFSFRAELQAIARSTHQQIASVDEILFGEKHIEEFFQDSAEDFVIVSVDDDDWFSPHLAEIKEFYTPNDPTYFSWKYLKPDLAPGKHYGAFMELDGLKANKAFTNNFAVNRSLLGELCPEKARKRFPFHMLFTELVAESFTPVRSARRLSAGCKTVASISFMLQLCDSMAGDLSKSASTLHETVEQIALAGPPDIPEGADWLQQPLSDLHSLYTLLNESRI